MKRLFTFLLALMLTWIGANAQTVVHECVAEISDWTTTSNNGTHEVNTWSTEADASGMETPFCQNWIASGNTLTTATISHTTLENLEAGYYAVSMDIRILNENGTSIGQGTTFNANDESEDLDATTLDGNEGSYGNSTEVYGTYHLLVNVTDGTLDINIQLATNPTYNWIAWKNLKVSYLGETATLSEVEGNMNSTVEATMKEAVAAWNEALEAGNIDMDLFAAAEEAIAAAEESVAYYAEIAELAGNLDDAGQAAWETTDTYAKYSNNTLETSDDFGPDMAAAQMAQTTANTDWSCVMRYLGDWNVTPGTIYVNGSTVQERYFEGQYTAADGKILYKTIEGIPSGTYTITFYAEANATTGRGFDVASGANIAQAFANNETDDITVGTATGISEWDEENDFHTFTCKVTNGKIEFGLQNVGTGGNWYTVMADKLTLLELGAELEPGDEVHDCVAEFSHWTQTYTGSGNNGEYALNTWSTESDASGMVTPFLQTWVYGLYLSDQTIDHDQLTGMPQGWYSVTVDARIFSESGETITGTATLTANNDYIYLISDGSDGTYGTESEEYGTYTVQCYVGDDGTLDIGFTIANANFNWLAWKNLSVVYLGETVEYNVGEATASETVVSPGQTITLTFADCTKGDEDAKLGVSSSANVTFGETSVTLAVKGTITFTFDVPEDVVSGEYTLTIPENTIVWTLDDETKAGNAAQTITFTVLVPATIDDGEYLIVDAEGYYLGGGLAYGTEAAIIGKPQFIDFEQQENGTYHLDSHQYNGATAHYLGSNLYFDSSAVDWTLMEVEGGYAIYGTADAGTGYLTSNGFQTVATVEATPYAWTLVTMDDIVTSMADATEDAPVDVTALIASPEMKRNSNTDYYKTWTVSTGSVTFGQNSTIGGTATANCAESWHSNGGIDVNQTITLPLAGTYKLSAQGFYDGDETIVLYADDDTADFPYASGVESQATAYQAFLTGTYPVGAITITTTSDEQEVTIGFKGDNSSEWVVMGELDLQYLGVVEETIEWEMTAAGWGTMILPFDAEIPSGLTLYAGDKLTLEDDALTVDDADAATSIAANTPYLVSGSAATYEFTGTPTNTDDTYSLGLLVGTLVDLSQAEGTLSTNGTQYVLQNHDDEGLAFYPITDESTGVELDAYHCYLTGVTGTALRLPGMSTGIVAVEGDVIANDAIYDLSGRRVSKAVKGVYIQNGKKVLVK